MSLDMFVDAFSEDGENEFSRTLVEQAFAPFVEDVKDTHWCLNLRSGEQTSVNMDVDESELIDGFSINRPPSYESFPEFWDALYQVLRQTRTFCFVAGAKEDPNCCAANPDVMNEVPETVQEIAEPRGGPRLVASAAELEAALFD